MTWAPMSSYVGMVPCNAAVIAERASSSKATGQASGSGIVASLASSEGEIA